MELSLNFEQLKLKSEYLHTNPKSMHFHENSVNPLLISWGDCVTILYSLNNLKEASIWNPVEPLILSIINPIISILTFDSKVYCIDNIGTIYHLKQIQRDSPDLFDCSPPTQVTQKSLFCNYEWLSLYSQKFPCDIYKATCYSDGIALIAAFNEWITIQFLRISFNDNNEPVIFNTCNKQIRPQKKFPLLVSSFISCTWRDWFSSARAIELFESNVLDSQDIFIIATAESKVYCVTSDVNSKNVTLFINYPQNIVHVQFNDFESKKILLVSSSGILTVMHCVENIPSSFIYLTVTKVVAVFIFDNTVVISDGVYLFLITLNKQFSTIIKQVVTPLKGVLTLHKYQFNNIFAMTQLNKVYKLSPKYEISTQEEEIKFKFNEQIILKSIKDLCKSIESLEEQHEKMNKYIHAISIVARKDLVAQYCSLNILIYSGAKAIKLGANQNECIFVIKLSIDCSWLSFPSTIWKILVRVVDSKNSSSNCGLYSFDVNLFDNNHPITVKHNLLTKLAENCSSGMVYCELICQIKNELINNHLIIPLYPIKLNSLYFVKAEKREKIPVVNALEERQKYIFKFPENLSFTECLTLITNKNKHRTSKSLYTNIIDNMSKSLYLNYFGKIVTIILDNTITNNIVLECIDREALIAVRNGIIYELSNSTSCQPVIIKCSVLADIQIQLCLLEELSINDLHNKHIFGEIKNKIQNNISVYLPV